MFPAARIGDPITHDLLVPSGLIGPQAPAPCPLCTSQVIMIEMLPAAHVLCTCICSGATSLGPMHPPIPGPQPPIVKGSMTVFLHAMPAARWAPSLDVSACGVFLGDPKLLATRTVLIGDLGSAPGGSFALALGLVDPAGSGTQMDAALVALELARLPPHILQKMDDNGTRVKVCRDSVTDYLADLRGVQPRGWPAGMTWDSVPGLYQPGSNEVVIATIGHGTADGAHVPATGDGHGSHNLVVHESMHAVDENGTGSSLSTGADFNNARNADTATLDAYESQAGTAGQEETYAESAARYYGEDPDNRTNHPNLHNYWDSDPLAP